MGVLSQVLAVSVAVLAGGFLLLNSPLPEGVAEPTKVKVMLAAFKVFRAVTDVITWIGPDDHIDNMRWMMENGMPHDLESAHAGDVKVKELTMAGVPVIVYTPVELTSTDAAPATVFFHGGGFVLLSARTYDLTTYSIAKGSKTIVISVDYRLAPDHPFPAGVHDCVNVTKHVLEHGGDYGIDVDRVGLAGDSAGGNLAAVVSLELGKDTYLPSLKYQGLIYPLLQAVDLYLPSYVENNQVTPAIIERNFISELMAFYFLGRNATHLAPIIADNQHIPPASREKYAKYVDPSYYEEKIDDTDDDKKFLHPVDLRKKLKTEDLNLLKEMEKKITSPLFSPFFAKDVRMSPPTFMKVSEFDVLRDEGLLYAQKLQGAGVKVVTHYSKGGIHGQINKIGFPDLDLKKGEEGLIKMYEFIHEVLDSL